MKHINHHEIVSNFSDVSSNHGHRTHRTPPLVKPNSWSIWSGLDLSRRRRQRFSCAIKSDLHQKTGHWFGLAQFLTHFLANVEGFFCHCTVKFPLQVMVSTYLMTRVHRCCTDEIPLLTVMCVFASEPESWSLFWF